MSFETENIEKILERYPAKSEYLIFLLQDIQTDYGYISADSMQRVSDYTGVPLTQAYAVTTFYQSFRLEPKGEHEIKVCLGTACHLKGGQRIVEDLERRLDIEPGGTTDDMMYTLDTVNCVGACAIAPVILVDEEYEANVTSGKITKVLKKLEKES